MQIFKQNLRFFGEAILKSDSKFRFQLESDAIILKTDNTDFICLYFQMIKVPLVRDTILLVLNQLENQYNHLNNL